MALVGPSPMNSSIHSAMMAVLPTGVPTSALSATSLVTPAVSLTSLVMDSVPQTTFITKTLLQANHSTTSLPQTETGLFMTTATATPITSPISSNPWVVNEPEIGTKFIIYGLLGFFFGVFLLMIIVDIVRRPQEARESIRGIGSFFYNFPRWIVHGICQTIPDRRVPKPAQEISLDRQFEHATIINRLAAKGTNARSETERASSGDASSKTAVATETNVGGAATDSVGSTSQSQNEGTITFVEDTTAVVNGLDTAAPAVAVTTTFITAPAEAHRSSNTNDTNPIAELEASIPLRRPVSSVYSVLDHDTMPRRPASSHYYSSRDVLRVSEETRRPTTATVPIPEGEEPHLSNWERWEASLLETVRNPDAS